MQGTNNSLSFDHNKAAQFFAGARTLTLPVTPAWAATMNLDPGVGLYQQLNLAGATTINATSVGKFGQFLALELKCDGTGRTATFGTNFRVTGTVAGTAGKSIIVAFFSDGTGWIQFGTPSAAV